ALKKLHTSALCGENLSALIFWVKARCGWRDTGAIQSVPQTIRYRPAFMLEPNPHNEHPRCLRGDLETEPEAGAPSDG
ncbi:MAG: hypothetical protein ACRD6B_06970, partial [Bryobacteraceae bacterium]